MTPPLHSKKSYVWIQGLFGGGQPLQYLSYSTGWRLNKSAENVSEAVVNGSDVVPDVEIHGITARGTINLIVSVDEAPIYQALGANEYNDGSLINYNRAVSDIQQDDPSFAQASKLNVVIAPLHLAIGSLQDDDGNPLGIEDIRTKFGFVYELSNASILDVETSGEVGDWVRLRLEVKTGNLTIWANEQ